MLSRKSFHMSPATSLAKVIKSVLPLLAIGLFAVIAFGQLLETRFTVDEFGVVSIRYFGSDDAY